MQAKRDETHQEKKDRNRPILKIVPEKPDMYANPYSSSEALQFSPMGGGGGHCKMQKISSKDLPEAPSLSASHLLWKSKSFTWICLKRCKRLHVKCIFFFRAPELCQQQTTSGVTKNVWIPWATDVYVLDNEDSEGSGGERQC